MTGHKLIDNVVDTQIGPAQGAVSWYRNLLNLLEKRNISKVDAKFLKDGNIASHNESKMIAGLKFLDLIDEEGNATEAMNSLNIEEGEKRKENLEKVVRNAYSLLFDEIKLDLEHAEPDTLIYCFKSDYRMGSATTAKKGARVFAFLAQKSGIVLSQSIIDKLIPKERKKTSRSSSKSNKFRRKKEQKEEEEENIEEDVLARITLTGTGYVDVKDKDTYAIAKAYMDVLSKKLGIED